MKKYPHNLICAIIFSFFSYTADAQERTMVFAGASLKNALDEVIIAYQRQQETPKNIIVSYAASSTLAKQIENGSPADLFVSADMDWMDYLERRNLIKIDSRRNILGNRLVLIAPRNADLPSESSLVSLLNNGLANSDRLAIGDTTHVPAGKYARIALENLGVWERLKNRLAPAESVRSALALVARGETPLGIVYQTDALIENQVRLVQLFPSELHPKIVYPIALIADGKSSEAPQLLNFIISDYTFTLFQKYGFSRPDPTSHP
ncbi:molybdate ABC transporter periplasmic binding protein [Azospirillaceae bacterium]